MDQTATTTARTIITHVGTSLLGCAALKGSGVNLKDLQTSLEKGKVPPQATQKAVVTGLQNGLTTYWKKGTHEARVRQSASSGEIASLSLMSLQDTDRIVLLHTDTASGRFCAAIIKDALTFLLTNTELDYPQRQAEIAVIQVDGLKVVDEGPVPPPGDAADSFIEVGLVNYVNRILDEYHGLRRRGQNEHRLIFNITGGYKGLVPVARDVALLLGSHRDNRSPYIHCSLSYLYQASDKLIEFGTFPVGFASDLPIDALEAAATAQGVAANAVEPRHRAFFQERPGDATRLHLSALGTVLRTLYHNLY